MFLLQLRRGDHEPFLLAAFTCVFEENVLVVLGHPLLNDDVVGITLVE